MAHEVSDAVMTGDEVEALLALRNKLAAAIDDATARDLPPLVLRLTDVLTRLGSIQTGGSAVDEVARRRDERRRAALAAEDADGGGGRPG